MNRRIFYHLRRWHKKDNPMKTHLLFNYEPQADTDPRIGSIVYHPSSNRAELFLHNQPTTAYHSIAAALHAAKKTYPNAYLGN